MGRNDTNVSAYTLTGTYAGNSSTKVTITFTATVANPVLAWGGHIATRLDWGDVHSAVAISGSPFHMRLKDLNGSGGNQDRALSNDAATFPAIIEIVKAVNQTAAIDAFTFSATPGIADPPNPTVTQFNLPSPDATTLKRTFNQVFDFKQYTIKEEQLPAGWSLQGLACVNAARPGLGYSTNLANRTATLTVQEGDDFTCTYTNQAPVQVTLSKACVPTGDGGKFNLTINGSTATDKACGDQTQQGVAVGASITVQETSGTGTDLGNYTSVLACTSDGSTIASGTTSATFTMPNSPVSCTVTNTP